MAKPFEFGMVEADYEPAQTLKRHGMVFPFLGPGMKKGKNDTDKAFLVSERTGTGSAEGQIMAPDLRENRGGRPVENRPIEPGSGGSRMPGIAKWVVFILIIGYSILAYYRVPILTSLGRYLILEHPLKGADLILCTPGHRVEQALAAADLYERGLAPRIFVPREIPPDGLQALLERGGAYPSPQEVFLRLLRELKVPRSALIKEERTVDNVREEAEEARQLALKNGYGSIIVVTTPVSSRRIYLVFKNVFKGAGLEIMIFPSPYSGFKADNWWQRGRYVDQAVIEYGKLVHQTLRDIW